MCKFKGCDDPNYRKFGAEMKKLYKRATEPGFGGELQAPLHGAQNNLVATNPRTFAEMSQIHARRLRSRSLSESTLRRTKPSYL
jgi:hypothetical protein